MQESQQGRNYGVRFLILSRLPTKGDVSSVAGIANSPISDVVVLVVWGGSWTVSSSPISDVAVLAVGILQLDNL